MSIEWPSLLRLTASWQRKGGPPDLLPGRVCNHPEIHIFYPLHATDRIQELFPHFETEWWFLITSNVISWVYILFVKTNTKSVHHLGGYSGIFFCGEHVGLITTEHTDSNTNSYFFRPSQLLARAVDDQKRLKRKPNQQKRRKTTTTKTKYICL